MDFYLRNKYEIHEINDYLRETLEGTSIYWREGGGDKLSFVMKQCLVIIQSFQDKYKGQNFLTGAVTFVLFTLSDPRYVYIEGVDN